MKIKDKKGSLLIISYLVTVVLITLGAAFVVISFNESRTAERQRRTSMAFHIAEAGVERALYDLRQDFVNDSTDPSWADGDINGFILGPDTDNFYTINYSSTSLNGGSYTAELKNVTGSSEAIWVKSTASWGDANKAIQVYARIYNVSPWNNAIFAGSGASGTMVNGNVNIHGSVHLLGTSLQSSDLAIDLGGDANLMRNNYEGLSSTLDDKVPDLPTTVFNGETVDTLNAELRVKRGIVGLSGSASVGQADDPGPDNYLKETVNGTYVTDGWGGSQGDSAVYSDNGISNAYDLGDSVQFPSLSAPYETYATYQDYLRDNALVITDAATLAKLAALSPNVSSDIDISDTDGNRIKKEGDILTISGLVYLGDDVTPASFKMGKDGSDKTITYTGSGSILVTGSVQIDVNLVTSGDDSYPNNILGVMTPNNVGFNEANIDVMGIFYAENTVNIAKQTNLMGTIVSNYFDIGTNVPSIYQVPETLNSLPIGMAEAINSLPLKNFMTNIIPK
jgi:hypothetical protein